MTVSESSMGVDEGEIIVNETGSIAFVWSLGHEWTIDHSSETRHNAALQETFVYRT